MLHCQPNKFSNMAPQHWISWTLQSFVKTSRIQDFCNFCNFHKHAKTKGMDHTRTKAQRKRKTNMWHTLQQGGNHVHSVVGDGLCAPPGLSCCLSWQSWLCTLALGRKTEWLLLLYQTQMCGRTVEERLSVVSPVERICSAITKRTWFMRHPNRSMGVGNSLYIIRGKQLILSWCSTLRVHSIVDP